MFGVVVLLCLVFAPTCRSQTCSTDDFSVTFEGAPVFTVSRLTKTCTCGHIVASGSGGGNISCTTLTDTGAATFAGTALFGDGVFNQNVAVAGGRNLNVATSGSSISTVNVGSASSASNLNVWGTLTAANGIYRNLNQAGGTFTVNSGITSTFGGVVTFNGPVSFNGGITSIGSRIQRDFYQWNTGTSYGASCVHLKTNIPVCTSDTMYRFLIEGYNYGYAAVINSEIVGYTYAATCTIINTQQNDRGTGITTSQYKSSDNRLVLKVSMPNTYYIGFSLSVWQVNPTWLGGPVQILSDTFPSCTNI